VFEWEANGVFGFSRPDTGIIHTLGFLLAPDRNDRHWCNPGTVHLAVNGVEITHAVAPTAIRTAGFRKTDDGFTLRRRGIYATLMALGNPPDYYGVEVGSE